MTVLAMRLGAMLSTSRKSRFAAARILARGYRFKVLRIDTDPPPTKMVDMQPDWNRSVNALEHDTMRVALRLVASAPISAGIRLSLPDKAAGGAIRAKVVR